MTAVESRTLPTWATPPPRTNHPPTWWPHAALAATYMTAFTILAIARYQRFADTSWDLGIFTQVAQGWASGHIPTVTIKGEDYLILGDHWSPILVLLGPLWRIWPSPIMLLTLQAALFAWSVGIVSDTAAKVLRNRTRGLLIGVAYGLSWGLQRALDVQYHEIAFAVPLLAIVGRHLLLRHWTKAFCWALPLLLVKEDLGLTVVAVGLLLLINRRRCLGPLLLVVGFGWTACALWWWIPAFNPAGFDYWAKLPGVGDHTAAGAVLFSLVTRHAVWTTLGWLAGCTAFLALRSPLAVLTLPTLAWRFVSDNPVYWGRDWHYSAVLMPILFLAAVDGIRRCRTSDRRWVQVWARNAVPTVLAIAATCTVAAPLAVADLVDPGTYRGGPHAAALRAALRSIPDGATVESGYGPLAHLAARTQVYWPDGLKSRPPQFILTEDDRPGQLVADQAGAGHPGHTYRVVFHRERVTVVRLAD